MKSQRVDYNFNASALGVGGHFVRKGKRVLVPSLASVALAPDGGEGWSSVTNYDSDGIAFTHAESRVSGYQTSPNFFTTQSDIRISNLSVFGKVTIGQLQGTVTSTRNLEDDADEASFRIDASFFGISVDGIGVVPKVDISITQATYDQMLKRAVAELEAGGGKPGKVDKRIQKQLDGIRGGDPIRATMVESMAHEECATLVPQGKHVIAVPNFATIHFGELLVKRGRRRFSLLRFDFDSTLTPSNAKTKSLTAARPDSGSLTVASGDGNGEPVWPRQ